MTDYYAVCDANGPISVRLAGDTLDAALKAFEALDKRAAIDSPSLDAEDDCDFCGEGMDEDAFDAALRERGFRLVQGLNPIINAQAGTVANLAGGWSLWAFDA